MIETRCSSYLSSVWSAKFFTTNFSFTWWIDIHSYNTIISLSRKKLERIELKKNEFERNIATARILLSQPLMICYSSTPNLTTMTKHCLRVVLMKLTSFALTWGVVVLLCLSLNFHERQPGSPKGFHIWLEAILYQFLAFTAPCTFATN